MIFSLIVNLCVGDNDEDVAGTEEFTHRRIGILRLKFSISTNFSKLLQNFMMYVNVWMDR